MTWQPPRRHDWVRFVNEGHVPFVNEVAALPLERDELLDEARASMGMEGRGIDGYGDDAFVEPLDVLLPALEQEARLSIMGRWLTRRFLLRLLEVRLQLVAYVAVDPGVRGEEIAEPLFVTGAPRTGTTILHAVLAADPRHRVPEGWELLRPVPPPDSDRFPDTARVALADRELRAMELVTGSLDAIHEYGGRMPKECVSSMSFEFRSEEFTARYEVPSYVAWLQACDMTPAYETHRLVLQVLQRRWGGDVQWVLKSPVHLHSLDALFAVYPDTRLAITHRDPLTVLGSVTSLVATLRWAHSDHVDFPAIARYHAALYHGALDGLARRQLDPDRVHHGHYAAFVSDPLAAVGELYDHFGWKLTSDAEEPMRAGLAARPKDKHGAHTYSFDDLGLDRDEERARFAHYQQTFNVPSEPVSP